MDFLSSPLLSQNDQDLPTQFGFETKNPEGLTKQKSENIFQKIPGGDEIRKEAALKTSLGTPRGTIVKEKSLMKWKNSRIETSPDGVSCFFGKDTKLLSSPSKNAIHFDDNEAWEVPSSKKRENPLVCPFKMKRLNEMRSPEDPQDSKHSHRSENNQVKAAPSHIETIRGPEQIEKNFRAELGNGRKASNETKRGSVETNERESQKSLDIFEFGMFAQEVNCMESLFGKFKRELSTFKELNNQIHLNAIKQNIQNISQNIEGALNLLTILRDK